MGKTAKQPDAQPRSWLQTGPGIGHILSLVRRDAIHDIGRFPSGQDVASDARLVQCSPASAGTRVGPSGTNIGHAHRKWAFAEAATLCLRNHPNGPTLLPRVEKNPGPGNALPLRAHTRAPAVEDRLKRHPALARAICRRASRSKRG